MSRVERRSWPSTSPELLAALPDVRNSLAWDEFDRRYGDLLRVFCIQKGLQDADAEDVTQQVFLEVARNIGEFSYDAARGRFRSWLVVVTQRAIWKVWQRRGQMREVPLDDFRHLLRPSSLDGIQGFQEAVLELASRQIRGEFSVEEWTVFERSFRNDIPSSEIAKALERSVSWVYQAKSRILKRLRQQVAVLCKDIAPPRNF